MSDSLRIAVAEDEADMRDFYSKMLVRLGHEVVGVAENGVELVALCHDTRPDLVLTDIEMPEMDGLTAVSEICAERSVPVILVTAHHQDSFVERARREHVLAYLVKPIKASDLSPAIALAMQRFEELQTLQKEADGLRQALDDRKLIERAKGILMMRAQIDEPTAFRRLQKLSNERNVKLIEIARNIIDAEKAFSG
ncbi:MAG: response regulator [Planctomycetaceae bacterium]|nr:response regulator [Planctomycetaceae bacterium]